MNKNSEPYKAVEAVYLRTMGTLSPQKSSMLRRGGPIL
jgi:hypothetical protein